VGSNGIVIRIIIVIGIVNVNVIVKQSLPR
jgi:hypothetical protein